MNCDKTLTIKAQDAGATVPLLTKEYDFNVGGAATVAFAAGYTAIFDHADVTNCPITSCTLMTQDCSTGLTVNSNFYISGTTPYGVTAKQQIENGWTAPAAFGISTFVNYCYKCAGTKYETGTYFKQQPNMKVRQKRNCNTHVQNFGSQPTAKTLLYNAGTPVIDIPLTSIFNIYGEQDCGVTTCVIRN